jgi:hypothetical protein
MFASIKQATDTIILKGINGADNILMTHGFVTQISKTEILDGNIQTRNVTTHDT